MFHSEACERNKDPILSVIRPWFQDLSTVLEIGSGTGQHARHFTRHLPHLRWQMSDFGDYLSALEAQQFDNLPPPVELDVRKDELWPKETYDAVFTANSLHIMNADSVESLFEGVGNVLGHRGILAIYGPFKYNGEFTSESNASFDQFLRQSDPGSGIRDFEWVNQLAGQQALYLQSDSSMPANNQCIIWQK
jgi:SAM-dependent methyltransferase